jgi:spore maturation protein CgeB
MTIHPDSVNKYRELGLPAGHLDFGCNPEFNKYEPPSSKYDYDVALVGHGGKAWKSYRKDSVQILLKPLVERGYNLAIWGKRWDHFNEELMGFKIPKHMLKGKLPYEETNKVYNSAKIIIGLQNDQTMLTSRTFEVLGSGGFLLTVPTRAVNNYFTNNVHLVCSYSPEHTVELVDYFLKNDETRKAIARNGQSMVYANHTYKERAGQILKFMQLY